MTYNYETEIETMKSAGTVWKPTTGQFSVCFMSEPENTEYKAEDGTITPQVKIEVRVDNENETKNWFVGKSKTIAGLFMQLMMLGKEKKGLKGQTITVLVKQGVGKDGKKKNEYTIVEALPIIKKYQELKLITEKV